MTEGVGFQRETPSVCKQHTESTALVLWTYIIALEPNVCYLKVAPMDSHRCLVSVECFLRCLAAYLICLEIVNGYIVVEKNMGNVVSVWDRDDSACVCLCHFCSCSQRCLLIHKTHLIWCICAFSPFYMNNHFPSVKLWAWKSKVL